MSDKKISQLTPATTPLASTEVLPIVQSGTTVKATVQDILGYAVNDTANSVFKTVYSSSDIGLALDFANDVYKLGDFLGNVNGVTFIIDDANKIIKTTNAGLDIGLKLDFFNGEFALGDYNGNNYFITYTSGTLKAISNGYTNLLGVGEQTTLGDSEYVNNGYKLIVDDGASLIKTSQGNNDIGLKLDFGNDVYYLGKFTETNIQVDAFNGNIYLNGYNSTNNIYPSLTIDGSNLETYLLNRYIQIGALGGYNDTFLNIEDTNSIIYTKFGGNDIGLKLDFGNDIYKFGQVGIDYGLIVDLVSNTVKIGDMGNTANYQYISVDQNNAITKTVYNNNDIGLKLDFGNAVYQLGDNAALFYSEAGSTCFIGDYFNNQDGTLIYVGASSDIIKTKWSGNDIGLKLDFGNSIYWLGDGNFINNSTSLYVNDNFGEITTTIKGIGDFGIKIVGTTYCTTTIGDFTNQGNGTFLQIDDINQNWIMSSNLSATTAGGSASKYLKVNIGGVDYKIALLNN